MKGEKKDVHEGLHFMERAWLLKWVTEEKITKLK